MRDKLQNMEFEALVRAAALEAYERRRLANASGRHKIDNSSLVAGSDMYFYCTLCGALADTKPETYLFTPPKLCSECQGLLDAGWLSIDIESLKA